ncbi:MULTISPECIES: hypothetical protein [unclassified Streptomyces]|uniref:hypothetical protein n=1 Tax=unclassified Streptomyces TaxID=2593676 RepID=UPI003661F2D4
MKEQMSVISLLALFFVFMAAIAAAIVSGEVFEGTQKQVVTVAGMVVSFVTSTILMRQQRVRDFLGSRPVLWFLFLFNAGAAVGLYFALDGTKGIAAAAAMGLVSVGAGTGLLRSPKKKAAHA